MNDKPFNPQPVNVRVLASFGLIAIIAVIAVLHAIAIVAGTRYAPDLDQVMPGMPKQVAPARGINFDSAVNSNGVVNTLPVNSSARDEVKRQIGSNPNCIPCQNQALSTTNKAPTATPSRSMTPLPTTPRYSIEVFVLQNDSRSNQILTWFDQDPTLKSWRTKTNYNIYSPASTTYRTRYVQHVPVGSFPAVLVTAPDGGHVYLATKQIPDLAGLKNAIADAVTRHRQMNSSPAPNGGEGLGVRGSGIAPDLIVSESQLSSMLSEASNALGGIGDKTDCADGQCDPSNRPGLLDRLRDRNSTDPVTGLLRSVMRPGENIFQIVIILALVVTLIYFVKRGMR